MFCPGRAPCVALATGLTLGLGEEMVWALFMRMLPGATGSSRRLLFRGCICLETGAFILSLLDMLRSGGFWGRGVICLGLPWPCC